KALNCHNVNNYFNILEEVIWGYNILSENIYNMDEKGLVMGMAARSSSKELFVSQNQELRNIVQTIYAQVQTDQMQLHICTIEIN
ncbi:hypothetical protein BDN71DRAFT_1395354, partial [Pleurotus eryngii]